ncbi:MAG: ABC transporter ATP-binding protein [Deltaproteobacteria bacterium]|nr:MAG: ABC transporter ATP-binding protein [Deltaproteobacteria bacterium]
MLRVLGVEVRYNGSFALEGVEFDLREGEVVSIVGPNGAGKTTLLKVIDGLLKPKAGTVYIDGLKLQHLKEGDRAKLMGYVPQRLFGVSGLSVFEFVLAGRKPYVRGLPTRSDYRKVQAVLEELRIGYLANRSISSLSGGEFQRVMIAKALVTDPKILLMDEPTANLDPYFQREILKLSFSLAREKGILVLMVLHDLTQALRYSDKVIMLHKGRIHAFGEPSAVLTEDNIEEVYGIKVKVLKDVKAVVPLS